MIKLYQAAMSSRTQKVRLVLEQKQLPWEGITVDLHCAENYSPEFKRINPKAIIPVLDDDGDLIRESNNICLYLDEKYPQVTLMPDSLMERSEVRTLCQLIDEQVHNDSSVCTYAMAFRTRIRATYDDDKKLDVYLADVPDAGRRYTKRQVIVHGTECPEFEIAVIRLNAMLQMMEDRLQSSKYLVGEQLSIADIVYSPYVTRLDHLSMETLWSDKPNVAAWYERIQSTRGYEKGMADFFIVEAIKNMRTAGAQWADKIQTITTS